MLIKTIVDENSEGAVKLERREFDKEKNDMVSVSLWIAPVEYDDAFAGKLAKEASGWYVHTTYVHDYESSTDAGDGRDDYSKEEKDVEISLDECIVKDGAFFGVVCKAFDQENFILITKPKICMSHPGNYSGRGYHFYRNMFFELLKKQ